MTDRLAEIRGRHTNAYMVDLACFNDGPVQDVIKMLGDIRYLLDEVERLQGIADNLTEEIELLRRDHADGLKVTGIQHQGRIR